LPKGPQLNCLIALEAFKSAKICVLQELVNHHFHRLAGQLALVSMLRFAKGMPTVKQFQLSVEDDSGLDNEQQSITVSIYTIQSST